MDTGLTAAVQNEAAGLAVAAVEAAGGATSAVLHGDDLIHRMMLLIIQIAVIIFAVRFAGSLMKRVNVPSVLGELFAGIIIGPYVLGSIPLAWLGFPHGVFPMAENGFPVSPELYGLSVIASIILLFVSGLETDLQQFLKYSLAGLLIGLGGVIVSFAAGNAAGVFWGMGKGGGFLSPTNLFLGTLCTATSVGITARILSEKKKMDSPEGVTILAAAIVDDVLGIIGLAVIVSLIEVVSAGGGNASIPWAHIAGIAMTTMLVCVVFTILGLLFANSISRFLKSFKNPTIFTTFALGIAFLVAGVFEMSGLAMIIGGYVTGLSLSKTDITSVLQENLHSIYDFFVPLFFAVMGMMVDVSRLAEPRVIKFGLIFTLLAILSKIVGCALPALFVNFNIKGALRIGVGMVPRGEVALIISGIGMSAGILDADMFGAAIIMTFLTTMAAPPILSLALSIPGKGTENTTADDEYRQLYFNLRSSIVADSVVSNILDSFRREGFFASMMDSTTRLYHIKKGGIALSMWREGDGILFSANRHDAALINTVVFETLIELRREIDRIREKALPREFRRSLRSGTSVRALPIRQQQELLSPYSVVMRLKAHDKEGVIRELMATLVADPDIMMYGDANVVLDAILERETVAPTELEFGVSMPHCRTDVVSAIRAVVGLAPDGLDYSSLDDTPVKLVIMVVSPTGHSVPHLQFIASLSGCLKTQEMVDRIVAARSPREVVKLLSGSRPEPTFVQRLIKGE